MNNTNTLYNIICSNIYEDYDAYDWIKPRLNYRDGILDMVSLRGHFSGNISYQLLGGHANVNFDKLFYRSEHQIIFEDLVKKITNIINDKERSGKTMSDPDIVDYIWENLNALILTNTRLL